MPAPQKTGSFGGPWVELERPKPPAVEDHYEYWADPPPEQSPRCAYWLRQLDAGWLPNRWLRRECYDCSSEILGVWIWEYINVLAPAIRNRIEKVLG